MIEIFFDGLCEPVNPGGVATYGYVIFHNGTVIKKGAREIGQGKGMTNNVAEYSALKRAVEWIKENGIEDEIIIKGDSLLVINQMKGIWRVKSATSRFFVPLILQLLEGKKVAFIWIPREKNKEADMLSRIAYKKYMKTRAKGMENNLEGVANST